MNIVGKKVIIRAIEERDQKVLQEIMNDNEVEKMIVGWAWPVSMKNQLEWFNNSNKPENIKRFTIEFDGSCVGLFVLKNIDWKNRVATTGIKLHKSAPKGMGIATDTIMSMQRYLFEEMQFHRLEGSWLDYNVISKHVHEKCGWKEEGIARKAIFKDNQYHDLIYVGILKEDYENLVNKNNYWD